MGKKLLWTGIAWIMSILPFLEAFGLHGSPVLVLVGAVLMVIGCCLMWADK